MFVIFRHTKFESRANSVARISIEKTNTYIGAVAILLFTVSEANYVAYF
jgi:hypothetical protein